MAGRRILGLQARYWEITLPEAIFAWAVILLVTAALVGVVLKVVSALG